MEFKSLIPILMFLIFFSIFLKRLKDFKKKDGRTTVIKKPPQKKSQWRTILGDLVDQIRAQMEAQKKAEKKESPWNLLLKAERKVAVPQSELVWEKNQEISLPTPGSKRKPFPRADAERRTKKKDDGLRDEGLQREEESMPVKKPALRAMRLSDAVIWSEILGRPLALRQEDDIPFGFW